MNRVKVNISDIKIHPSFLRTHPQAQKLEQCRQFFDEKGFIDRDIVVDKNMYLRDGYIGYLVLVENGITETEVVKHDRHALYRSRPTTYVFGHHLNSKKEYCWRVTKSTYGLDNLKVGHKMIVKTKYGKSVATIARIERIGKPPISLPIKKVIRCLERSE